MSHSATVVKISSGTYKKAVKALRDFEARHKSSVKSFQDTHIWGKALCPPKPGYEQWVALLRKVVKHKDYDGKVCSSCGETITDGRKTIYKGLCYPCAK